MNSTQRAAVTIVPAWLTYADCRLMIARWRRDHAETGYLRDTDPPGAPDRMDRKEKYRLDHFINSIEVRATHQRLVRSFLPHIPAKKWIGSKTVWAFEDFRIGCYRKGGFFKLHRDDGVFGREWTLVCALNSPKDYLGGELVFPELGLRLKLPAGDAVIFDARLLHGVRPVRRGSRFALISFACRK